MVLDGFEIAGFRSFGPEPQRCSDLGKINVILGPNNGGKSNVLRFCRFLSSVEWVPGEHPTQSAEDCPIESPGTEMTFGLQIKRESPATGQAFQEILQAIPDWPQHLPELADEVWLTFRANRPLDAED